MVKALIYLAIIFCFLPLGFAKNNGPLVSYDSHITGKEIVTGMPFGSPKITTGIARVVKSSADLKKIECGDIIVTVMTCESWQPSLKKSSGIITNLGDGNCHAAWYGKNHAIPVVVGAGNATEKIVDGHLITIDCSQGMLGRVYRPEVEKEPHMSSTRIGHGVGGNSSTARTVSKDTHSHAISGTHQHVNGHNDQKKVYITTEFFDKHFQPFLSYVTGMQKTLNRTRRWLGDAAVLAGARLSGESDFAVKCIPLVYDFFDQDEKYIESIIKKIEMDYVNFLFELYSQKPGDMEWLAHVSHIEHINKITLPEGVDRNELGKHPEKYNKMINKKQVDSRERDVLTASSLFVRYCVEKKVYRV